MVPTDWRIRWAAPIVVLAVVALGYWWLHPKARGLGDAYISEKSVTLWTSTAEVRQPAAALHYGDRVTILARQGIAVQVKTAAGATGWMDASALMDPALWQSASALLKRAQAMEPQARGYAKTTTNVHIEPGRATDRIYQFGRNVPVVILARAVAPAAAAAPPAGEAGGDETSRAAGGAPDESKPKFEDWLLVMRDESAATVPLPAENAAVSAVTQTEAPAASAESAADSALPMAGWVLARFIQLDPPGPVRDNALSSDLRVVAWFELNRVPTASGEMPQYLVAGSRGEEGQECDFTLLRVYTWDDPRQRYETAFVESDLCGKLPIHVSQAADGPEFRFAEADEAGGERAYVMHRTMVSRVGAVPKRVRAPRRAPKRSSK
jgi:hypothetical protein